ncbi:hypothetical protein KUCAC02_022796, partial [Chaenocephalus aceratus]
EEERGSTDRGSTAWRYGLRGNERPSNAAAMKAFLPDCSAQTGAALTGMRWTKAGWGIHAPLSISPDSAALHFPSHSSEAAVTAWRVIHALSAPKHMGHTVQIASDGHLVLIAMRASGASPGEKKDIKRSVIVDMSQPPVTKSTSTSLSAAPAASCEPAGSDGLSSVFQTHSTGRRFTTHQLSDALCLPDRSQSESSPDVPLCEQEPLRGS